MPIFDGCNVNNVGGSVEGICKLVGCEINVFVDECISPCVDDFGLRIYL